MISAESPIEHRTQPIARAEIFFVTRPGEQLRIRHDLEGLCRIFRSDIFSTHFFPLQKDYERARTNHYIKYGDMPYYHRVEDAFFKQKHRMLWERRHGPVGSGMKEATAAE